MAHLEDWLEFAIAPQKKSPDRNKSIRGCRFSSSVNIRFNPDPRGSKPYYISLGRSSGLRIILLTAPSRAGYAWHIRSYWLSVHSKW